MKRTFLLGFLLTLGVVLAQSMSGGMMSGGETTVFGMMSGGMMSGGMASGGSVNGQEISGADARWDAGRSAGPSYNAVGWDDVRRHDVGWNDVRRQHHGPAL